DDVKSRLRELALDQQRIVEEEIDRDSASPPLLEVDRPVPDVEAEQQRSAATENSTQLTKGLAQLLGRDVTDRVKGDDPGQALRLRFEPPHVALQETDSGVQLPRPLQ